MKHLFPKGNKYGHGRPIGSKNKDTINYLDLQAFARLIWLGAEKENLSGKELIELGFRGINLMFQKIPILPGTPLDSLRNAEQQAEVLKSLETQTRIDGTANGAPRPPD